jgi:hypothetical protein
MNELKFARAVPADPSFDRVLLMMVRREMRTDRVAATIDDLAAGAKDYATNPASVGLTAHRLMFTI